MNVASHPWNRSFEWADHAGPFRVVTPQQARDYDELGYFVLEDAVETETVRALDEEIAPFDAEVLRFLESRPDGRFSIAGIDTVSIAIHIVRARPCCATSARARSSPVCATTSSAATPACTGTEDRHATRVPDGRLKSAPLEPLRRMMQ